MGANIVNHAGVGTTHLSIPDQKHCPIGYQALLVAMLPLISFKQQALLRSESNRDHSKIKDESVKKTLEKSCECSRKEQKRSSAKRPLRLQ